MLLVLTPGSPGPVCRTKAEGPPRSPGGDRVPSSWRTSPAVPRVRRRPWRGNSPLAAAREINCYIQVRVIVHILRFYAK